MVIDKEVNPHFEEFIFNWEYKTYMLVGGYGSSKSYHIGLKVILKLLEEKRKCLIVRQVFDTMRDSTYSLLEEIISDMNLEDIIKATVSPMKLKFPNGSEIIFKGMDKPMKLKSIHDISLIWIEECSEISYAGYKELLGRARHPSLPIHFILSSNPVGKDNWTYKHFFKDRENKREVLDDEILYRDRIVTVNNTYYHHSVAEDNLFLPDSYLNQLIEIQEYDPDLYRIAREGKYGVSGEVVLPQFTTMEHEQVLAKIGNIPKRYYRVGMDFGFVTSYNAILRMAIDDKNKILYIYWEYYKNNTTDDKTVKDIKEFKETKELIRADSAEPKTIAYFNQEGIRMVGAKKGPGSRLQNTKKMKRFKKIVCSDKCVNTINECENLTYAVDKNGDIIEDEFNIDPHTFEAMWYGLDGYEVADLKARESYSGKGAR